MGTEEAALRGTHKPELETSPRAQGLRPSLWDTHAPWWGHSERAAESILRRFAEGLAPMSLGRNGQSRLYVHTHTHLLPQAGAS